MPKAKFQRQECHNPQALIQNLTSLRQQCCVVCYKNFTPFEFNSEVWDANMIKNFYLSLGISNAFRSACAEGEDEEEVLSLPFCPQCHTKVSVMAAYQIELQNIRSKCNSIRNDLAFTVVETIGQNSRDGPIDYIRQQIHDKWKLTYHEQKINPFTDNKFGLEYIASDSTAFIHNCGNFVCCYHSQDDKGLDVSNTSDDDGPTLDADGGLFVSWKDEATTLKARKPHRVGNDRAPPLLSPQKTSYYNPQQAIAPSVDNNTRHLGVRQKGRKNMFSKAFAQRRFAPKGSSLSPITNLKRKVDCSQMKPKSKARFLNPDYSKLNSLKTSRKTGVANGIKASDGIDNRVGITTNKRKLSLANLESRTTKYFKESPPPNAEALEPGITIFAPVTPPHSSLISAPSKINDEIVEVHHIKEEGLYPCLHCPKVYAARSGLLRHESDLHPECKMYQCDVADCSKGFSSKEAFKRHVHNTHNIPNDEIQMFKCVVTNCQKTFLSLASIEKHSVQKHSDEIKGEPNSKPDESENTEVVNESLVPIDENAGSPIPSPSAVAEDEKIILDPNISEIGNDAEDIKPNEIDINTSISSTFETNSKTKRKPAVKRLFGVRRRKRGSVTQKQAAKVITDENPKIPNRRQQKRKPVVMEPTRKSSRQRAIQFDNAKTVHDQVDNNEPQNLNSEEENTMSNTEDTITDSNNFAGLPEVPFETDCSENSHKISDSTPTEVAPWTPPAEGQSLEPCILDEENATKVS